MAEKKQVEFKVLRKNQYGHRFILEPKERIRFRERCKYNKLGTICEKRYSCPVKGGILIGCSAGVSCPRLRTWDEQHGLELGTYTMVANDFPDLKPTTFTWHPSVESPGKRRVLMVFQVKGHEKEYYTTEVVRFASPGAIPASCVFKTEDGVKKLAVAWAYYDEITKGIADWMVSRAESEAWAWWPEKETTDETDK